MTRSRPCSVLPPSAVMFLGTPEDRGAAFGLGQPHGNRCLEAASRPREVHTRSCPILPIVRGVSFDLSRRSILFLETETMMRLKLKYFLVISLSATLAVAGCGTASNERAPSRAEGSLDAVVVAQGKE